MLNRIAQVLLIVVVTVAVFISVLPSLMRLAAISWLESQGLEVTIERVEIDLDDGILKIIAAQGNNPEGKGFTVGQFHVDLAWQPLWDRQLVIERIEIQGLSLDSMQDEAGLRMIGGINLVQQPNVDDEDISAPWDIHLGDVVLGDIKACHVLRGPGKSYCLSVGQLDWQGSLMLDTGGPEDAQPEISASLNISDLEFVDKVNDQSLLSNEVLSLSGLSVKGLQDIRIDRFTLSGLLLWPKDPAGALVQMDILQVDNLALSGQSLLKVSSIELFGIGADIQRDEQGLWELQKKLSEIIPESGEQAGEKEGSTLSLRLGVFKLAESHPIHYTDNSLKKPFHLSTQIKSFVLTDIDTGDAEKNSELQSSLLIDQHGLVELGGQLQLLAQPPSFDLTGSIKGLDLRPVSSYVEEGLGYRINSGQLNAELRLLSIDGQLNSLMDLDLKQFKLKTLSKEDAERMQQRMGFPLDTALNLLRERDNSIQMQLPVTGDINNPDFDVSDIIFKATATAMTSVIINYYTPFGLVTAAKGLFDLATALSFEPVLFDAGSSDISGEHIDYLANIRRLLDERPQLHVTLCGYSNAEDLAMFDPGRKEVISGEKKEGVAAKQKESELDDELRVRLLDLAGRRAESVKAYLSKEGVGADRLILCDPAFELDAIIGVEVSI